MRLRDAPISEAKCEILVIGSEAAGARAAIEARGEGADVLVVSKGLTGRSGNTIMAGQRRSLKEFIDNAGTVVIESRIGRL